eukprot:CAMPEP_0194339006 /NCGR_PEP_ID=MMETSP0171-20130528/81494_1 /TAXON_ID=218684 /ORGANISM="Corethron pennatum, Strain L29A3" /LENGTH=342 /DNA_ID=CAMNT_0039103359 /DNA_START=236 /DNA_END=1261 /DNA_ORIENTATION=+
MVLPVWLTIGLREDLLGSSFETYYPMTVAMIFGSMIAGSTPIGGGVIGFPVSVLLIGFTANQGRDFSLMIQSVGMTGASFLIFFDKFNLMMKYGDLVGTSVIFSLFGLVIGFKISIAPFVVMCIYTSTTAAFAIVLAYVDECLQKGDDEETFHSNEENSRSDSIGTEPKEQRDATRAEDIEEQRNDTIVTPEDQACTSKRDSTIDFILLAFFSLFGGIVSSQIGTGADITFYAFGSLIHNSRKYNKKMNGIDLTAASIVIMTSTSIFGTILRVSTTGTNAPTTEVYEALIASACIVIIGAPLGALFLSESNKNRLKILFYVLAFVQIVTFGIIKVKRNVLAW